MSDPVDIDSATTLGALIRARRRELELTQSDLAGVANASLRFVSEVERGKPTARLDGVLRLLAALGIELKAERR